MIKKKRKPRGIKLNGNRSLDLCPHCFAFFCDTMTMSYKFQSKIDKRLAAGLCGACGHNPCTCKSSLNQIE
jgi:hypothetical protein